MSFNCTLPHFDYDEIRSRPKDMFYQNLNSALNISTMLFAIAVNLWLMYVVRWYSHGMRGMGIMIFIHICLDTVSAVLILILQPIVTTSYGHYISFANGYNNYPDVVIRYLAVATICISAYGWAYVPMQFIYRFHTMYTGQTPSFLRMLVFSLPSVALCIAVTYAEYQFYMYRASNLQQIGEIIFINDGFPKPGVINGAVFYEPRMLLATQYQSYVTFYSYFLIIVCQLGIWYSTNRMSKMMTSDTKKRSRSLNRLLITMAIVPIFTTILPSQYYGYNISLCAPMGTKAAYTSILFVLGPLIDPIVTFVAVGQYRKAMIQEVITVFNLTCGTTFKAESSTVFIKSTIPRARTG